MQEIYLQRIFSATKGLTRGGEDGYNEDVNLSVEERAYIAGLFDGEGCITGHITNGSHFFKITISMSNKEVLEWVHGKLGNRGSFWIQKKRPNRKVMYSLGLGEIDGGELLEFLYPYLIVKKNEASLFITYVHFKSQLTRWHRRDLQPMAKLMWEKLKELKRG